ncbi:hypothetical protein LTR50_000180 [Elasticomyces elasticus]|nr:hypothetical protein LTR50_000180 [Elasticomyces elasticus]
MANSDIDQKILGSLAKFVAESNALLSSFLYQVLGLSVILSRKLFRARKLRKLDLSRETKSLSLYHHILWLAREGLSITEVYILPRTQDGQYGAECCVMAAKLRASFYHVFCLFYNYPPVSQLSVSSFASSTPTIAPLTPRANNGQTRQRSPSQEVKEQEGQARSRKAALRDAIPSITSEASYITNPYAAGGPIQSPPPAHPPPPLPTDMPQSRQTPNRPPGLAPVTSPASANFLLPPLNFVPPTIQHFQTAANLATTMLPGSDPLRLSVALEHAAFLWDCAKDYERSRRLARRAIKDVYEAPEGMDDVEFKEAAALVQLLGAMVRRGTNESTPKPGTSKLTSPSKSSARADEAARSRASPAKRPRTEEGGRGAEKPLPPTPQPPSNTATASGSTRPQSPSPKESAGVAQAVQGKGKQRRRPSSKSDKEMKRRAVERAEEEYRRNNASSKGGRR